MSDDVIRITGVEVCNGTSVVWWKIKRTTEVNPGSEKA